MLAYTYVEPGKFELRNKPKPVLLDERDAIVRVTLSSICTPALIEVTALPTASTIPTISCPTVIPGTAFGTEPCLI